MSQDAFNIAIKVLYGGALMDNKNQVLTDSEVLLLFKSQLKKELRVSKPFMELLGTFIMCRRQLRKRMTAGAVKLTSNKLNKYSVATGIKTLSYSIENSYVGVFPERFADETEQIDVEQYVTDKFKTHQHFKDVEGLRHDDRVQVFIKEIYELFKDIITKNSEREVIDYLLDLLYELNEYRNQLSDREQQQAYKVLWTVKRYKEWLDKQNWVNSVYISTIKGVGCNKLFQMFIQEESRQFNNNKNIITGHYL